MIEYYFERDNTYVTFITVCYKCSIYLLMVYLSHLQIRYCNRYVHVGKNDIYRAEYYL